MTSELLGICGKKFTGFFRSTVEEVNNDTDSPSDRQLETAVARLLRSAKTSPRLLALGEPTHGDDTFLSIRNRLFLSLAEREGFTVIALEIDAERAELVDNYVRGAVDDLDHVLAEGFSHGFGRFDGNRELLTQMRRINSHRPADELLRCTGFDAAMELSAEDYASAERAEMRMRERSNKMANNLGALVESVGGRGRVMAYAHNAHIQIATSSMQLGPQRIQWETAGSILARRHEGDYVSIVTSCGSSPARGVQAPPADSIEDALNRQCIDAGPQVFDHEALGRVLGSSEHTLRMRDDLTPAMALGPLDPRTVMVASDAVLHVPGGKRGEVLTQERLREMIGGIPDVAAELAGPETGAPEIAWGDTFFTNQPRGDGPQSRWPFATIVTKNYPGFDEDSDLDRPDTFALNLHVGAQYFEGLLGFPPSETSQHVVRFNPAAEATPLPHPQYAKSGWIRIINPPAAQQVQIEALARAAAERGKR